MLLGVGPNPIPKLLGVVPGTARACRSSCRRGTARPPSAPAVCVVVDKRDKIPKEEVVAALKEVGCEEAAIDSILGAMAISSIESLAELLGDDAEPVKVRVQLGRGSRGACCCC